MQDRIKEHDLARTETSANEVKFINRDPYYYTRKIKEAIHIGLHPNNINRDSGIEIPEAWMPTIKTTGEPCDSGPPREQISECTARIEMHRSELLNNN
ncbi:hypothetical protein pdam_00024736, partial [Pocillopora damicornis]